MAVGALHHITQRGNNRQDVFLFDEDRKRYLALLRKQCLRHDLALLGWCLMSNHVHLVALPRRADSLAKALGQTHQLHAQWFNRRYGRSGHLWQNRFFSCALGRDHVVRAAAYVDLNPVRAGMVPQAVDYPWSSARAHVEGVDPAGLLDLSVWKKLCRAGDWAEVLADPKRGEPERDPLREATQTGRPWGGAEFVEQLERREGRRLRAGTPGRPRRPARQAAAGAGK